MCSLQVGEFSVRICVIVESIRLCSALPLLSKLSKYNINSTLLWLKSYPIYKSQYASTFQKGIQYNFNLNMGVPQGCFMGPISIKLFVNDLVTKLLSNVTCTMFGYDISNCVNYLWKSFRKYYKRLYRIAIDL